MGIDIYLDGNRWDHGNHKGDLYRMLPGTEGAECMQLVGMSVACLPSPPQWRNGSVGLHMPFGALVGGCNWVAVGGSVRIRAHVSSYSYEYVHNVYLPSSNHKRHLGLARGPPTEYCTVPPLFKVLAACSLHLQ